MSLNGMMLQEAQGIIDLFTKLLINRSGENRYYFGYSELKGYDILDVENAVKLLTAYHCFITEELDKEKLKELENNAINDNAAIMNFCSALIPDQILSQLNQYNYKSSEYIAKECELVNHLDNLKMLGERETIDSFLQYCIRIKKNHSEYWPKVYYRLGLVYNSEDETIKSLKH